ncbi:MAG: hypothetical protein LRY25_01160 [Flavobacterium sp.]|nr:hypothetical protein [Flavobacterium sp.]
MILNSAALQDIQLKEEIKITLYRVLQELMVNMKKHSECTLVAIAFKNNPTTLEITYSDNGKGIQNQITYKKWFAKCGKPQFFLFNGTYYFCNTRNLNKRDLKVKITIPK